MKAEHADTARGGRLRAAVFGLNDGLVTNASLVVGVAAASSGSATVILAGVAGLVAGAVSMAAGEYISVVRSASCSSRAWKPSGASCARGRKPSGARQPSSSAPRASQPRTPSGWPITSWPIPRWRST